jgi:16S rRNA (cytosine1402-N4)-methyltransferase
MMATSCTAPSFQQKQSDSIHHPVMAEETVSYLLIDPSGIYVDATFGAGGHAGRLLHSLGPQGRLIGIDRDDRAIDHFRRLPMSRDPRVTVFHSPFSRLKEILMSRDVDQISGILFDLGLASFQIDDPQRGFSYLQDGPLDMRMNTTSGKTAREIVNEYSEERLAGLIREYGQERRWRHIARAISREREKNPIEGTRRLADTIRSAIPQRLAVKSLARVFQALRIEINKELDELRRGLEAAVELLKAEGRLVVLCYQSLEDRIVKEAFTRFSGVCRCPKDLPRCVCGARPVLQILTRRALRPSSRELAENPRARSARLRAARKLPQAIADGRNQEK